MTDRPLTDDTTDDMRTTTLEVRRDAVGDTRLVEEIHGVADLQPGEIRLRVDRFAVTANNITYAVFGDALGYWDFFPTGDDVYGRVPAMGWATVVESHAPDISLGRRFYGWYPMSSHVVFTPTATADGFRDDGAHRQQHAPVYRSYVATDADTMYPTVFGDMGVVEGEERHILLRGLFLTGFLAEEFFADGGGDAAPYFGTPRVIVLSASSKTAIGFAQRAALRDDLEVVGVTSAGNVEMVESLGYYDTVVTYDEIDTLDSDGGAVSIDMAGNPAALAAVHRHFGDGLAYSMTVGRSHHDAEPGSNEPLVGPEPQLFFAPTASGRLIEKWGKVGFARQSAEALSEFVGGSTAWLSIERRTGPDGAQSAWVDVHAGGVAPDVGLVVTVGS
jgi:hypothetical protein